MVGLKILAIPYHIQEKGKIFLRLRGHDLILFGHFSDFFLNGIKNSCDAWFCSFEKLKEKIFSYYWYKRGF